MWSVFVLIGTSLKHSELPLMFSAHSRPSSVCQTSSHNYRNTALLFIKLPVKSCDGSSGSLGFSVWLTNRRSGWSVVTLPVSCLWFVFFGMGAPQHSTLLVETRRTHAEVVISSVVFHPSRLEFKHTHSWGVSGGAFPPIAGEIKAVGLETHVAQCFLPPLSCVCVCGLVCLCCKCRCLGCLGCFGFLQHATFLFLHQIWDPGDMYVCVNALVNVWKCLCAAEGWVGWFEWCDREEKLL